ncbi:MAG: deoxyribose-phosphate aldolase [Candidatus Fermentibacteraceae bacterium]
MTDSGDIPGRIDHTVLRPDATSDDVARFCHEAVQYGFRSVCVNPCRVVLAASILGKDGPFVCSVAGFPLGSGPATPREAELAVSHGAREIDAVIPLGLLKDGATPAVSALLKQIVESAGVPVKVILETCLLTNEEKVLACRLAVDAGASCVKTSTGFSTGGATGADVALLRRTVGEGVHVKASGGVSTLDAVITMLAAGASIIGTSSGVMIAQKLRRPEG